jgi:hypothetical protein
VVTAGLNILPPVENLKKTISFFHISFGYRKTKLKMSAQGEQGNRGLVKDIGALYHSGKFFHLFLLFKSNIFI